MFDMEGLRTLLQPVVETAGYEVVRIAFFPGNPPTLQIMAEDPLTGQMGIDDCERLSRIVSDTLDSVDPIDGEYTLEVSSPGIDRPLTRLKDYARWTGHIAKVELTEPHDFGDRRRRRFSGELAGTDEEIVLMHVGEDEEVRIPFDTIKEGSLVLTDELIEATRQDKQRAANDDDPKSGTEKKQ